MHDSCVPALLVSRGRRGQTRKVRTCRGDLSRSTTSPSFTDREGSSEQQRIYSQTRIYPYPMVSPLPRPWSQSPSEHCKPYALKIFFLWSALFWIWSRRPRAQWVGPSFSACHRLHQSLGRYLVTCNHSVSRLNLSV